MHNRIRSGFGHRLYGCLVHLFFFFYLLESQSQLLAKYFNTYQEFDFSFQYSIKNQCILISHWDEQSIYLLGKKERKYMKIDLVFILYLLDY